MNPVDQMPDELPPSLAEEALKGLWRENPVFVAVLGLCPAMAVTNSLINALVMGAATTFVLVGSSLLVSLLRKSSRGRCASRSTSSSSPPSSPPWTSSLAALMPERTSSSAPSSR